MAARWGELLASYNGEESCDETTLLRGSGAVQTEYSLTLDLY